MLMDSAFALKIYVWMNKDHHVVQRDLVNIMSRNLCCPVSVLAILLVNRSALNVLSDLVCTKTIAILIYVMLVNKNFAFFKPRLLSVFVKHRAILKICVAAKIFLQIKPRTAAVA